MEVTELKVELEKERAKNQGQKDYREMYTQLSLEVTKYKEERQGLTQKINEIESLNNDLAERIREDHLRIASERDNVNAELNELFEEKAEKDVVIKSLTNENLELNSKISSLEQFICA